MNVLSSTFKLFYFTARNVSPANLCSGTPSRLCKTRYNTTAPMYGVSLTSGQPVTIVQKFPDLLQQVVFEVSNIFRYAIFRLSSIKLIDLKVMNTGFTIALYILLPIIDNNVTFFSFMFL